MNAAPVHRWLPLAALLASALVWGLVWYPFRVLRDLGLSAAGATLAVHLLALALGTALLWRRCRGRLLPSVWLPAIALSAGWTNFAYSMGVTQGEVLRVLLLFFTAPLWTVLFSRVLLREKPSATGLAVVALSFGGAAVMLWDARSGWPRLDSAGEWFGLSAGVAFALTNVMVKKDAGNPIEIKSLAVWAGVSAVAGIWLLVHPHEFTLPQPQRLPLTLALLLPLALAILGANLAVQYGLMRTSANRAAVLMLFELVVAALSAWLLDGERIDRREWIGGLMIGAGALCSGRLNRPRP